MSLVTDQIEQTALRYGLDPALAKAVAQQESGFNQSARGSAGEVGVFQLMPGTASDLGVNPYDQTQNIEGGIAYLKQLLERFGGDERMALVAYNAGPTALAKGEAPASSYAYADSVLGMAEIFGLSSTASVPSLEPSYAGFLGGNGTSMNTWVLLGLGAAALVVLLSPRD